MCAYHIGGILRFDCIFSIDTIVESFRHHVKWNNDGSLVTELGTTLFDLTTEFLFPTNPNREETSKIFCLEEFYPSRYSVFDQDRQSFLMLYLGVHPTLAMWIPKVCFLLDNIIQIRKIPYGAWVGHFRRLICKTQGECFISQETFRVELSIRSAYQ